MNNIFLALGGISGSYVIYKSASIYIDRLSRRAAAPPAPPAPSGTIVERDVIYSQTPQGSLKLDIYKPEEKRDNSLPVLLHIHGGGWNLGSKDAISIFEWQKFAQLGYAVVTINYRLSDVAVWPAQIHDCKKALRWIRQNADKYNFNPDRIAVMGASAGAHLSALIGTSGHTMVLDGDIDETEKMYAGPVQALVDVSGPTDLSKNDQQRHRFAYRFNPKNSIASRLFGEKLSNVPELVREANPITYIKDNTPPFLIIHGENDHVVAPGQAQILHDALQSSGNKSELIMVKDAGHTSTKKLGSKEIFNKILLFLDQHLKTDEYKISYISD